MKKQKTSLTELKRLTKNTPSLSAARFYHQQYSRQGGKLAIWEIRKFGKKNKKKR